jgi:type IV pilus assembly protein PilZ
LHGCFIRSVTPPRAGVRVAVRIYFAEGKPEDFVGVVEQRDRPEGESGFWVRFDAVSAQARERLQVATGALPNLPKPQHTPSGGVPAVHAPGLRHTPSGAVAAVGVQRTPSAGVAAAPSAAPPKAPATGVPAVASDAVAPSPRQSYPLMGAVHAQAAQEARRSRSDLRSTPRYAATLRTRFASVEALREEVSHNVSAGGMFIRTDRPPPLREVVRLSIELPGESVPLEVLAEVMHVVRPEQATAHLPAGVGVQFVQADDRFREQLDRYLATHK